MRQYTQLILSESTLKPNLEGDSIDKQDLSICSPISDINSSRIWNIEHTNTTTLPLTYQSDIDRD